MKAAVSRRWRAAPRQAGFTLIEIMVALVVSSLLIGMILSIFTRMSMAYRAQQHVAEVQQTLAAAQAVVQRDLRQAGYQVPHGFLLASDATSVQAPVQVINNADGFGPDQLRLFYADASAQASVTGSNGGGAGNLTSLTVDDRDRFANGDLAVMVHADPEEAPVLRLPGPDPATPGAVFVRYHTCVLRLTGVAANTLTVDNAAPWGSASNGHCATIRAAIGGGKVMIYRFTARAYRIDPTRRTMAILQMSPSGGLVANDWQDLGMGFTDLQVATRWNDWPTLVHVPVNNRGTETWRSGENQEVGPTSIALVPAAQYTIAVPSEARVSLVARTMKNIDAVTTAATPLLADPGNPTGNDLGDRLPVTLAGVADGARPAELRGEAIYRHATVGADLRNMAVGH